MLVLHTPVTTSKDLKSSYAYPRGIGQKNIGVSDTKVLTMKMEILLEPTSNKLLVGDMSVLTDPEDQVMVEMEIPRSSGVNSQPHAHT
ncbi:hypothetical protein Tco_0880772 [Tanacetum coccineum]